MNEETDDDDESEEEGSLNGLITHGPVASEDTSGKSHDVSDNDVDSDSHDVSDGDKMILSQIQRNKDQKREWKFEADMLAAFGKDPQRLYVLFIVSKLLRNRRSGDHCTTMEGDSTDLMLKVSHVFSLCFHLRRGSTLAEFLTNGDPLLDVKKSVKELDEYDPRGVETCRTMAFRYSKQLYKIHKKKEDPFFKIIIKCCL
ncbi:uncharacterized protein LOC114739105 [Neltuma alba]|uniref:uncharacterized protein LOC114739105 n=1 Tax=Neltuma alba TaxID=207710 RepID=UPI0010A30B06|nr:uncharacterized protein LOC114739105 [Prosopis alba]